METYKTLKFFKQLQAGSAEGGNFFWNRDCFFSAELFLVRDSSNEPKWSNLYLHVLRFVENFEI